jgi:hypothetical protein
VPIRIIGIDPRFARPVEPPIAAIADLVARHM